MYHLCLLDGIIYLTESLRVPALIQPVYMVLADKVEIVLVLGHHKVIIMQIVYKLIQHKMQPELFTVYKHKTCVEKVVA